VNIADAIGQYFTVAHNLNSRDLVVYITGKTISEGWAHQRYFGLGYIQGWERTYGTLKGLSVVRTSDGGYAITGQSGTYVSLVKTDADGIIQWSRRLLGGDDSPGVGAALVQTSDGGYAIACYLHWSVITRSFLLKTYANGTQAWFREVPSETDVYVQSVVQTSDGGYAMAGYKRTENLLTDVCLVKINANGNLQWQTTFGGTLDDRGYSLIQTSDGGYAIAGDTYSFNTMGGADVWLIKTDVDGSMQWQESFGGPLADVGRSLVQTSDGGYAIAGDINQDIYLVKTYANGTLQWHSSFGEEGVDSGYSLVQTSDGGYAIAGDTNSGFDFIFDFIRLIKTDANGYWQWQKKYTDPEGRMCARSLVQTSDGGYAIVGYAGLNDTHTYLLKTERESGLAWTDSTANTITLYRGKDDVYWNYVRVQIWTTTTGGIIPITPPA
jgi:hypothetical protein